ncbi:MAG: glycosyltransferase family 4 protein [Bacteroidetes bacterium]|nr:glycosyltransferase family 4 protein [Bacteroidota bacterium]HET6244020.1 glycosyltransferase family 4 protein [Bacteroidia bacterium]
MKILFLTPYPEKEAPSQRFRFEQYLDFFEQNGITCKIESFLNKKTWSVFYSPGNKFMKTWGVCMGITKRFLLLFKLHQYDLIFIHRETCFIGPAIFEKWYAHLSDKKIIYDFDDSIWLHDVSDANEKLGWLKSPSKTAHIIKYSGHVIAGNNYLASYAKKFNDNVSVIPTTIDTSYHHPFVHENKKGITIGWTGSETTVRHFELIIPILKRLKEKYDQKVNFLLISNKPSKTSDLEIEFIKWSKETEIENLSKIDIGIMPLPDDMWAKGKCGFKGLQYMALEIPAVMSPVGVNAEIIEDGVNGFIALDDVQWIEKLSKLIESEELRKEIGRKGRETVIEKYSVESQKERYLEVFNKVFNLPKKL